MSDGQIAEAVERALSTLPDTVFVVMPRGVYEHGPLGVFRSVAAARALCESHSRCIRKDYDGFRYNGDGHHSYVVYSAPLDGGEMVEIDELFAEGGRRYGPNLAEYRWRIGEEAA
jgi:hypothetical protein